MSPATPVTEPAAWSRWSRLMIWMLALFVLGATAVIALGGWLIVNDESDHTDDWDGFGTWIGILLAGFAALVAVVSAALLGAVVHAHRRARDRGDTHRLRGAAGAVTVAAGLWLVFGLAGISVMSGSISMWNLLAVPAVPLLAASLGVFRTTDA